MLSGTCAACELFGAAPDGHQSSNQSCPIIYHNRLICEDVVSSPPSNSSQDIAIRPLPSYPETERSISSPLEDHVNGDLHHFTRIRVFRSLPGSQADLNSLKHFVDTIVTFISRIDRIRNLMMAFRKSRAHQQQQELFAEMKSLMRDWRKLEPEWKEMRIKRERMLTWLNPFWERHIRVTKYYLAQIETEIFELRQITSQILST